MALRARTLVIRYEPDPAVTARLGAFCRLRVVWGGDETVRQVRAVPLPPRASELTFADRFSMVALGAPEVLGLDDGGLAALAVDFHNDAYWFDQLACSSPRLVLWRGDAAAVEQAQARFWPAVGEVVRARRPANVGQGLRSLTAAFALVAAGLGEQLPTLRADGPVRVGLRRFDPELREGSSGGGLFPELRLERLLDLAEQLDERDQTLGVFGLAREELVQLADALPAGALDRIVPVGRALEFGGHWDGHDLLRSFTRAIVLPW